MYVHFRGHLRCTYTPRGALRLAGQRSFGCTYTSALSPELPCVRTPQTLPRELYIHLECMRTCNLQSTHFKSLRLQERGRGALAAFRGPPRGAPMGGPKGGPPGGPGGLQRGAPRGPHRGFPGGTAKVYLWFVEALVFNSQQQSAQEPLCFGCMYTSESCRAEQMQQVRRRKRPFVGLGFRV